MTARRLTTIGLLMTAAGGVLALGTWIPLAGLILAAVGYPLALIAFTLTTIQEHHK